MELLKLNIQLFGASASNSGTTTSTGGNKATVAVSFSEGAYNVSANTSPVSVAGSFTLNNGSFTGNHSLALYWHDDNLNAGNKLISSTPITSASRGNVFSLNGSIDVTHKNDGSLNGYAYVVWQTANGQAGTYTPAPLTVYTANTALTTIPRASSVSCTTANIGSNATISITRASSSFTHTLTYNFGGATGTIATKTSSTSVSWTLPTSFYAKIPSANSGTGTITCTTYNGDTAIGTSSCSFTANVPSTAVPNKPTISATRQDSVNLGVYVIGKSQVKLTPSAFGSNYSATMKSCVVTFNGATLNPDSSGNYIANVTQANNTFSVKYIDSRDKYNTSDTGSFTAYTYNAPTCSISASRNSTTPTTIDIKYSGTITNVNNNNNNTKKFKIEYKESTASSWTEITTATDTYTKSNATTSKTGTDKAKTYDIRITAQDSYGYSTAQTQVGTEFTLMNFKADGTGMAVGKVCENANTFEVGLDTKFTKKIGGTFKKSGTEGEQPFWVRGIVGCDSTADNLGDLHLQYGTDKAVKWGKTANSTLNSNGTLTSTRLYGNATNVAEKKSLTAKSHSNWGTNNGYLPDMSFIAYWNGAYNSSNNSNLTYNSKGIMTGYKNLYNNTTGTTGTITLSETSANFTWLDIYYYQKNNGTRYDFTRVYAPNGKIATLSLSWRYSTAGSTQTCRKNVSISGTSITTSDYSAFNVDQAGTVWAGAENVIYIVRVDGWKG